VSRIDRHLPGGETTVLQKAGWTRQVLHYAGLVYWRGGTFVAVVLTWTVAAPGPHPTSSPDASGAPRTCASALVEERVELAAL
jgi:hypothetical protein